MCIYMCVCVCVYVCVYVCVCECVCVSVCVYVRPSSAKMDEHLINVSNTIITLTFTQFGICLMDKHKLS